MIVYTSEPGKPTRVESDDGVVLTEEQRTRIDSACDWLKTDAGRRYLDERALREQIKLQRLSDAWIGL